MVVLICNKFKNEDTGKEEFLVDYAFDADTMKPVIVPCDHPSLLGGRYSSIIGEWVIE